MPYKKLLIIVAVVIFNFLAFSSAQAARLYLDPAKEAYGPGDIFSVKIRLDTEGECVNVISVAVQYTKELGKAVDVSRGESIISLWLANPEIDLEKGIVSFIGGIPNGYCGRIKGDPGMTNILGEIIFQATDKKIKRDSFKVNFLEESQILLNDGRGTSANLKTFGTEFIPGLGSSSSQDNWLYVVKNDTIPPEAFNIELSRVKSIFGDKYFISFSTTDKQSGLDHYEVMESDLTHEGYKVASRKIALWVPAKSPQVLEDQTLNSLIRVKAVDKAGNEQIAVLSPDEKLRKPSALDKFKLIIFSMLFVLVLMSSLLIHRKISGKKFSKIV